MSLLPHATLGFAIAEHDHDVREEGGNNRGERVRKYLANTDPPINTAAPWCAAWIQYISDVTAQALGLTNPLDEVRLEALVQSYVDWAEAADRTVLVPEPGDLVAFRFGRVSRWNHIGILARVPDSHGMFWSVEGNTGDVNQRDGDGVYLKPRFMERQPVTFIRWGA